MTTINKSSLSEDNAMKYISSIPYVRILRFKDLKPKLHEAYPGTSSELRSHRIPDSREFSGDMRTVYSGRE